MKTIIFSSDEKLIEECRQQGEIVVAKDPIKTLQAMKKLDSKEEYKVVGEDKYVEVAEKLGYNKPEPKETQKETPNGTIDYNAQIISLKNEIEELRNEMRNDYKKKVEELDKKKLEIDTERTKIKKTIKNILNETD